MLKDFDRSTKEYRELIESKWRFGAFLVSRNISPAFVPMDQSEGLRNRVEFFKTLSAEYQKLDSGGAVMNNIG